MTIRKATIEDIPAVHQLVVELAIFEKEPQAVTASISDYEEQFARGLFEIIVAEIENEIVGMMLYYDTFSTWKGKMLYLEDFVVNDKYRSQGIGSKLYDAFIAEAKNRECTMVKWQVIDWNEGAVKFYERKGATIEKQWWNVKKFLS